MARTTNVTRTGKRRTGALTISRHTAATCARTGKRRWRDAHQAAHALTATRWAGAWEISATGSTQRGETSYYKCRHCNGFHLTHEIHRTPDEWREHLRLRAEIERAEAIAAEAERQAVLANERRVAAAAILAAAHRAPLAA